MVLNSSWNDYCNISADLLFRPVFRVWKDMVSAQGSLINSYIIVWDKTNWSMFRCGLPSIGDDGGSVSGPTTENTHIKHFSISQTQDISNLSD